MDVSTPIIPTRRRSRWPGPYLPPRGVSGTGRGGVRIESRSTRTRRVALCREFLERAKFCRVRLRKETPNWCVHAPVLRRSPGSWPERTFPRGTVTPLLAGSVSYLSDLGLQFHSMDAGVGR